MGLDNPAATIFWLAPVMGTTMAIMSGVAERWWRVFDSRYVLLTTCYLYGTVS
jgi:solute carrier family 35, member C2